MEGFTQANLFELHGNSIYVTYSSTNILGGPILSYRDDQKSLSFRGKEIMISDTELVTLPCKSRYFPKVDLNTSQTPDAPRLLEHLCTLH
jgi:hypothetical protein